MKSLNWAFWEERVETCQLARDNDGSTKQAYILKDNT